MAKLSVEDVPVTNRRVFVRVDFNVPLNTEGNIGDDRRIREALPTIRHLQDREAKIIMASHLGRPKGKADSRYSLAPVARHLGRILGQDVPLAPDCVGPQVEAMVKELKTKELLLLENLRFHPQEEANDPDFCRQLAALCDVYINDAFGAAHRAHASTAGMIPFVSTVACGLLMKKELDYLGRILSKPEHPFRVILGGAKVSDKIGLINHLLDKVDALLIGGAMAYTFLKVKGIQVGISKVESDRLEEAREILARFEKLAIPILLPLDHVIAQSPSPGTSTRIIEGGIPEGYGGFDIGPRSRSLFAEKLQGARTIFWNGPVGVFEVPPFHEGTLAVAQAVASSGAISVVGGGDSVAAITQLGLDDKITHLSTGGGATLEFLEGRELPGVASLPEQPVRSG